MRLRARRDSRVRRSWCMRDLRGHRLRRTCGGVRGGWTPALSNAFDDAEGQARCDGVPGAPHDLSRRQGPLFACRNDVVPRVSAVRVRWAYEAMRQLRAAGVLDRPGPGRESMRDVR